MAKELSPGRFEREDGDPCPRGSVTDTKEQPCRGMLVRGSLHGEEVMRCPLCLFTWGIRYKVPMMPDDRKGKPPRFRVIPDRLIDAMAKANWERKQATDSPDPNRRITWEKAIESGVRVTDYRAKAKEILEAVWPEFGAWFEEVFGAADPDAPAEKSARIAIEEIAVPTLERYEEKYDTPDTPRIALEAIVNAR